MPEAKRTYIAIDLKSYYASVECRERGLDPMTTNLVVADLSRTEKTICLAVSPSLKAYGIPGRARLFEVVQRVKEVNAQRRLHAPGGKLVGKSADAAELKADASLAVDYLVAPPRMARYIEISTQIYNVYLKYVAPEDIHVYSIDEVMMDVTSYLQTYRMAPRELAKAMILDVLRTTGITATAGIGGNLYLCKVAMDIMAKHVPPDEDGVRIAELLIDHAWGWEPCRMQDIKAYRPETNSVSSGQVLQCPYDYEKARRVVREMAEAVALDLLEKRLVTDQLTLTVGYDIENTVSGYHGETVTDRYGRRIPKHAHGTANLPRKTSSARSVTDAVLGVYDAKVDPKLTIRRLTITANRLVSEDEARQEAEAPTQLNLFDSVEAQEQHLREEESKLERERRLQEAMLGIKKKFGKNAILNGGSYLEGATARERNGQIGGHKA